MRVLGAKTLMATARYTSSVRLSASASSAAAAHSDAFTHPPEIVVLGGGFGGLYTALRLDALDYGATMPKPRVSLVDASDRFAFLPMLYELTTGSAAAWEVAPPFEDVLNTSGVNFVHAEALALNRVDKTLTLRPTAENAPTRVVSYDQCVLATGAAPSFAGVPGAAEHAQPYYTVDDALALRATLLQRKRAAAAGAPPLRLVIVGGSYVGVELAANLASWLPPSQLRVSLVHRAGAVLGSSADFARMVAKRRLEDKGVEVHLNTQVVRVEPTSVELKAAEPASEAEAATAAATAPFAPPAAAPRPVPAQVEADLIVWAAGTQPSALVREVGLPLDERGRVRTSSRMVVIDEDKDAPPSLFALGDVAAAVDARGEAPPATAQVAMQQADYVAWNVRAAARGERLLPFRYLALGEMLSLGDDAATVSALGGAIELEGRLASASRRAVYAARMPTARQAVKVGVSWAIDAVLNAAKARPK